MKKLILLLAVMLMAAPAMADVTITVTDDGDGWALIEYSHDEGANFIRAFALDITASNDVNIVAIDSNNPDYWVYPGSIDINDAGGIDDEGSPVADAGYPGTLGGLDTNAVTIEMGALFEAGVDPDPAASGVLLRLQLDPAAAADAANVCVVGNAIRGNVVMKDASSNEPDEACAVVEVGGEPDPNAGTCWDNVLECAGQSSGDSTCDGAVNIADLMALKASWFKSKGVPGYNCCADFDHSTMVNIADLMILKANWFTSGYTPSNLEQSCPP